jgi:hypothetical protein
MGSISSSLRHMQGAGTAATGQEPWYSELHPNGSSEFAPSTMCQKSGGTKLSAASERSHDLLARLVDLAQHETGS